MLLRRRAPLLACALLVCTLPAAGCRSLEPKDSDSALTSVAKFVVLIPLAVVDIVADDVIDAAISDGRGDGESPDTCRYYDVDRGHARRYGGWEPLPEGLDSGY